MNRRVRKRFKQFIRKLLAPTGLTRRPPDRVTWRAGDPGCLVRRFDGDAYHVIIHKGLEVLCRFVDGGDKAVAALMVINGRTTDVFVNPGLSVMATWRDEDIAKDPVERLRPHASRPPDMLEARRISPREGVAGELYFRRKAFGAACFATLIEGVFYQFWIAPAEASGAIERRA